MNLYARILVNKLKTGFQYKFDFVLNFFFAFLFIALQASIWMALYGGDFEKTIMGVGLGTMLSYSVLTDLLNALMGSGVLYELSDAVLSGEITNYLLWPVGFRKHLFATGMVNCLYRVGNEYMLPCILAIVLYGVSIPLDALYGGMFILSLGLGVIIAFLYQYILGLLTIWLKNSFFISNLEGILTTLFSGAFVPLWFFPGWLNRLSLLLPFRYTLFEPMRILLKQIAPVQAGRTLLFQLIWAVALYLISSLVWARGRRKLFVYGG